MPFMPFMPVVIDMVGLGGVIRLLVRRAENAAVLMLSSYIRMLAVVGRYSISSAVKVISRTARGSLAGIIVFGAVVAAMAHIDW
jgi:hypothetical protein